MNACAERQRLARRFTECIALICGPHKYNCWRDDEGKRTRAKNYLLIEHCRSRHNAELARVDGWWWLIPR